MGIDLHRKRVRVAAGKTGLGATTVKEFGTVGAKVAVNELAHPENADALWGDITKGGGGVDIDMAGAFVWA